MAALCTSTCTWKFLLTFLNIHTREKNNTSPLHILRTLVPQLILLLSLMLVHTWYKESTLGALTKLNRPKLCVCLQISINSLQFVVHLLDNSHAWGIVPHTFVKGESLKVTWGISKGPCREFFPFPFPCELGFWGPLHGLQCSFPKSIQTIYFYMWGDESYGLFNLINFDRAFAQNKLCLKSQLFKDILKCLKHL